jgi:hypothetical protein
MDAKTNRKRTVIPAKQKNVVKLVMWTLYQVLDEETAKSKTFELLKLNESIENIIEQVDNIEKTEKYGEMETMMMLIHTNQNVKKQTNVLNELSGDTDTIIKQMVEMATAEVKATEVKVAKKPRAKKIATEASVDDESATVTKVKKPRAKKVVEAQASATDEAQSVVEASATETKVKKPRVKKVAKASATEASATEAQSVVEASATEVVEATETKVKKPRAKKVASATEKTPSDEAQATEASVVEATETKVKKPRAKKVASVVEASATEAQAVVEATETKVKKPRAKKVTVEQTSTNESQEAVVEATETKVKKPRAKKTPVVVEAPVKEEVKTTEDLQEEEYLILNEIEYEGTTYMVGTDQNVYDEFNAIIGKYENEKVILN